MIHFTYVYSQDKNTSVTPKKSCASVFILWLFLKVFPYLWFWAMWLICLGMVYVSCAWGLLNFLDLWVYNFHQI